MKPPQPGPSSTPGDRGLSGHRDDGQHAPVVVIERPAPRRDALDVALRLLAGLALLLLVALLGGMLLLMVTLAGLTGRMGDGLGGVGSGVGQAVERVSEALQRAGRDMTALIDPAHPPREPLVQDTEFDELRRVSVDDQMGTAGDYLLLLVEIRTREGATNPDEAQYAVVRRRLETPRETRILGFPVRTDYDEADYFLYKGESFRLGSQYYKVNWISPERRELAVARYRHANEQIGLKFQLH